MKTKHITKLLAALAVVGSCSFIAFAGDNVQVSGSDSTITSTKTGVTSTSGSDTAMTSGTDAVSGNVGEGTKHGDQSGSGK